METTPHPPQLSPRQQTILLWLKRLSFAIIGGTLLLLLMALTAEVPTFEELENPKYNLASVIYDNKRVPFGRFYIEDRVAVDYRDLSPWIQKGVVATEDDRFYAHSGIDFYALFRVGIKTILLGQESSGGGSTITQQLAKILFKRPDMSDMILPVRIWTLIHTKIREWVIAVKLERRYTKEEILAMYLNKFEFINGAHGIEAAAQIYYGKKQKDLTADEAAVLIGMLKNPSLYNPMRFPAKTTERRNVVLSLMRSAGMMSRDSMRLLSEKQLDMSRFSRKSQSEGPAPYFRSELAKWIEEQFEKKGIKKEDGSAYDVYTDGLRIYTTLDMTYQKYAEEAVAEHMKVNQKRFWQTWKNLDPWTYGGGPAYDKIRTDMLEAQVKSSDRYVALRQRVLGPALAAVEESFENLPLSDNAIKALQSVAAGTVCLEDKGMDKIFAAKHIDTYAALLKSPEWGQLDKAFEKLQAAYDKEFTAPRTMKVFDIETGGEKTTMMSPLDSVRYHRQHLQAGFLAIHPRTGHVKAWVGGINHSYFKYDHVTMRRAVGSTIKPFVYVQAMSVAGISPCQEFEDIQYTIIPGEPGFDLIKEWAPANASQEFTGEKYNLYRALLNSVNSITVKLLKETGSVTPLRDLLHNLGIDRNLKLPNGQPAVPEVPSICLGAVDLTLLEMTGAYSAFSNSGTYTEPTFVTEIQDKNGKVIYRAYPTKKAAINPLYNAVMVDMLKNNVAGAFYKIKTPVGGKTGTTNDYTDGWFMSVSPDLVTGTWCGGDDKWIRFLGIGYGQGAAMSRPMAELFYQKLEKDTTSGFNIKAKYPNPPAGYADFTDCNLYRKTAPSSQGLNPKEKAMRQDFDEEF